MTNNWLVPVSGAVLVAGGLALFMGLVGSLLGASAGEVALTLAGSVSTFLLEGLSWSAFFLPGYLWMAAIIVFLPGFRRDLLFVLLASLVPFAVTVYLARVLDAALLDSTVSGSMSLSKLLTVVLLGILVLALCILILALRIRLFRLMKPESGSTAQEPVSGSTTAMPEESLFVESESTHVSSEDGVPRHGLTDDDPASDDHDTVDDGNRVAGFRLPPLPPALNLSSLGHPRPPAAPQGDDAGHLEVDAELLEEEAELLEEEAGLLEDEAGLLGDEAGILPVDDEPIPVLFGRRTQHDRGQSTGGSSESVSDPATDAGFWDEPGEESAEETGEEAVAGFAAPARSGRGALLPKVEVFADGTHTEALREAGSPRKPGYPDTAVAKKATGANLAGLPAPSTRRLAKPLVPYTLPTEGILTAYPDGQYWIIDEKTRHAGEVLKETLKEFNIQAEVTGIRKGPVITMFEILPAPGVRLSKIATLSDNIALRLAASSVRIVAPIPGKHAVGIEVPNERRAIVSFKEIVENEVFKSAKMEVPVVLGKDISGDVQVVELTQTPHLLIAGATGSGKSVCVNSIILSILYKRSFNEVKLILIDPKIVELKLYNGIPHLLTPVITEPKKAFQALQYCICEMERRYSLLDAMGVRDIRSYNRKITEKNMATDKLPYIVVIIDEFADLMATTGKELESTLARLAAMSRAVGIHLVLATQRPSIDVITGLIKANIPSRIAFMVAGKFDSRIIIDMVGAEKLLGRGDMLYSSATDAFPIRMQGAFVSEEEVERVVAHVKTLGEPDYIDDEMFIDEDEEDDGPSLFDEDEDDPLFEKALEIVLSQGKASASFLQRKLKIGYNRAARIVELMEEKGIVGKAQGSKPRDLVRNPDMGGPRIPNPKAKYTPDPDPVDDDGSDDYEEPEMLAADGADRNEADLDEADLDEPEAS
ncbi:MAG: DNA translocase FtsK [Spirochaetia bacterium]|jgi:S-DNA-T family DNA segregation ATPase FtsK/SpoIIIE|nr:DNA translocase FtsK [Spirochaetia bacterium]